MKRRVVKSLAAVLLAGTALESAYAQDLPAPAPETPEPDEAQPEVPPEEELGAEDFAADEEGAIIVTATRLPEPGAVPGNITPELQLDPREIRAYGAGSITELLDALGPQTQSGRGRGGGRPVILLNGRRISSFREIRDLPPEALLRVDILPEEAALQFGYRADQRVVNFVLRPRFRAITTEAQFGFATDGGRPVYGAEGNILRLNRDGRWSIGAEIQRSEELVETQRGLPDPYRTLLPATEQAEVNGTYSQTIFGDVAATVNASLEHSGNNSLLGLGPDDGLGFIQPIDRESRTWTGHLGLGLNGDLSDWRWSFTSNYDRTSGITWTDSRIAAADPRDRAEVRTETANAELLFNGPLTELPGGDLRSSFNVGAERQALASENIRAGVEQDRALSRGVLHAQGTLDIPIASRRSGFLDAIGNLSANLNGRVEHFSDFGTLTTLGYGLNWSPIDEINIRASVTHEEGAPSMQQLGDPVLATSGVRVLDFVRGETVDITRIAGGNPNLTADNRRVISIGTRIRPLEDEDLVFTADYTNSRTENPISSFPAITAEIESAFPERFVRNADGQLVSVDARPVNFAWSQQEQVRWGINYSRPVGPQGRQGGGWRGRGGGAGRGGAPAPAEGSAPPPAEGATPTQAGAEGRPAQEGQAAGTPPAENQAQQNEGAPRAGRGPGGRGFGRFGGGGGGRLQLSAYHTIRLQDQILIREGLPPLDLLNGSAAGSRGGRPRHEVQVRAGLTRNGIGARLSANWQSGTTVQNAGGGDLRFSPTTSVDLRVFADLGQQRSLVEAVPFLRGSRLSLSIDNLFNSRPEVTDQYGLTPLAYQGGYLDPLGRSVRISFRKQFFGGGGRPR